jgi:hypothetical protein
MAQSCDRARDCLVGGPSQLYLPILFSPLEVGEKSPKLVGRELPVLHKWSGPIADVGLGTVGAERDRLTRV